MQSHCHASPPVPSLEFGGSEIAHLPLSLSLPPLVPIGLAVEPNQTTFTHNTLEQSNGALVDVQPLPAETTLQRESHSCAARDTPQVTARGSIQSRLERFRLRMPTILTILAIAFGASVGAVCRWGLGLWLTTSTSYMAWGTLASNLIGGGGIGVCIAVFKAHSELDPIWQMLCVTGFLGGLTTFSSFSGEVVKLIIDDQYLRAWIITITHMVGSMTMTFAGIKITEWLFI